MAKKKFYQMNKGELEQVAKALHVDVATDHTKQEIISNILDAGFDEDDYWKRLGVEEEHHDIPGDVGNEDEDAVNQDVDEEEAEEEPADDGAGEEAEKEEFAYGRFLGRNLSFVVPEGKFSRQRPVFRTTAENLDALIEKYPNKFRRATEREKQLV